MIQTHLHSPLVPRCTTNHSKQEKYLTNNDIQCKDIRAYQIYQNIVTATLSCPHTLTQQQHTHIHTQRRVPSKSCFHEVNAQPCHQTTFPWLWVLCRSYPPWPGWRATA